MLLCGRKCFSESLPLLFVIAVLATLGPQMPGFKGALLDVQEGLAFCVLCLKPRGACYQLWQQAQQPYVGF